MEAHLAALEKKVEEQNQATNQKFEDLLKTMQHLKESFPEMRSPGREDISVNLGHWGMFLSWYSQNLVELTLDFGSRNIVTTFLYVKSLMSKEWI